MAGRGGERVSEGESIKGGEERTHAIANPPQPPPHLRNVRLTGLIPRPPPVLQRAEAHLRRVEQPDDVLESQHRAERRKNMKPAYIVGALDFCVERAGFAGG